jgi:hypothetical protein
LEEEDKMRRTFDHVLDRIGSKGDTDEQGKDLFGGSRAPLHQTTHVEHRVEDEKERVPQSDTCVQSVKVQVKLFTYAVYHWKRTSRGQKRRECDCGSIMNLIQMLYLLCRDKAAPSS